MAQDFEAHGRSAPSVATAAGIQTAAVYAFAFMLLLAGTDDAGLLARAMRGWIALVDPYLRWITFFGLVPSGGPDGHLAVMHRHLLAACVFGVAVFVVWTRGYRGIWAHQLLVKLLRAHRTEARLRRIGESARRQAALGAFAAALLVLLPTGGTGVGWYFFLAPLASGTVSYCLTHFIIIGRLAD